MPDESPGDEDSVQISAIAHVQEHVRDASRRRLLEGRQDAPNLVDLVLHDVLLLADPIAFFVGCVEIELWGFERLPRRRQANVPEFVDHITLRMPMLVLAIAEDFHELLQDGRVAAVASLGELGRVVEVTIDLAFVFIVGILCTKDRGTDRTSKMLYVVLAVESGNIGAAQGTAAFMTK